MNKRVIFHVGPPKTGSSAIQQFFHQHRQQLLASGVLYPAHSVDENGISSGNAREICAPDPEGRLALDRQKLTHVLNAFEKHPKAKILLLSSESFFRILDDIIRAVPEAEIICFLRNPVEFQLSIYNQSVKRHGNQKPFTPGKRLNLGQWESVLKAANQLEAHQLHCFAYKNHGKRGNVIADVIGVLGLQGALSVSENSVNVSYSFAALELKRWLNQFPISALQGELDAYLQAASAGAGRYRLLDDETLAAYKDQLADVTTKFQQLLPEQDWQLVTEALNKVAALPWFQQGVHESDIAGLVGQLRRDKPMLFRALSVIVDSARQPDYDASLKGLFELSRGARWLATLPLFCKRKLGEIKQKLSVSAHNS
ncbi:MAG: sulfotransferase, partial [Pseudomonadota bacterium]|nr:sulfotransferase [Pseudomonadota bacterium]